MIEWIKFIFNDNDKDSNTIYNVVNFKLKRLKKSMLSSNICYSSRDLQALEDAIKLSENLYKDVYYKKYEYGKTKEEYLLNMDKASKETDKAREKLFDILSEYMMAWWA